MEIDLKGFLDEYAQSEFNAFDLVVSYLESVSELISVSCRVKSSNKHNRSSMTEGLSMDVLLNKNETGRIVSTYDFKERMQKAIAKCKNLAKIRRWRR